MAVLGDVGTLSLESRVKLNSISYSARVANSLLS